MHNQDTLVFDHTGSYIATITIERSHWLRKKTLWKHKQFTPNHTSTTTPIEIETELVALIQIFYHTNEEKKLKHILTINQHINLHPTIINLIIKSFQPTHSNYSAPLPCLIPITRHNSPHRRDTVFISPGQALLLQRSGERYTQSTKKFFCYPF